MGGLRRALAVPGHRLPLVAAGAVVLVLGILVLDGRFRDDWSKAILLLIELAGTALLLGVALLAPERGPERPSPALGVLLLAGLVLAYAVIGRAIDLIDLESLIESDGASFVGFSLYAAGAVALWRVRPLAMLIFLAAVAAGIALLALVSWITDPEGPETFKIVLVVLVFAYSAGHLLWRERRRREAVLLVDAAGLAVLALGLVLLVEVLGSQFALLFRGLGDGARSAAASTGTGAGWEIALLVGGVALVAFAAVEREPGPGFLGVIVLAIFTSLAAGPTALEASLLWWPLLLILLGAAVLAAGLRPARPLPPEPGEPGQRVDLDPPPR